MISIKNGFRALAIGSGLLLAASGRADAGLILTYEAAGVQSSQVSGVTTESFNGTGTGIGKYPSLTTAVGTLTSASPGLAIVGADQFGGAGGSGNYFAVGAQSGTTSASLALNGPQSYFGFWWSAADSQNSVSFYSGSSFLGAFSPANVLAALGSSYLGNPNGGADAGEKFAYINIFGTNGTTIDRVVFNNASTGSGFEADNFSVRSTPATQTGTAVANGIVPEPSSIVMVSIAGVIGIGTCLGRRRRGLPLAANLDVADIRDARD